MNKKKYATITISPNAIDKDGTVLDVYKTDMTNMSSEGVGTSIPICTLCCGSNDLPVAITQVIDGNIVTKYAHDGVTPDETYPESGDVYYYNVPCDSIIVMTNMENMDLYTSNFGFSDNCEVIEGNDTYALVLLTAEEGGEATCYVHNNMQGGM